MLTFLWLPRMVRFVDFKPPYLGNFFIRKTWFQNEYYSFIIYLITFC